MYQLVWETDGDVSMASIIISEEEAPILTVIVLILYMIQSYIRNQFMMNLILHKLLLMLIQFSIKYV